MGVLKAYLVFEDGALRCARRPSWEGFRVVLVLVFLNLLIVGRGMPDAAALLR